MSEWITECQSNKISGDGEHYVLKVTSESDVDFSVDVAYNHIDGERFSCKEE